MRTVRAGDTSPARTHAVMHWGHWADACSLRTPPGNQEEGSDTVLARLHGVQRLCVPCAQLDNYWPNPQAMQSPFSETAVHNRALTARMTDWQRQHDYLSEAIQDLRRRILYGLS